MKPLTRSHCSPWLLRGLGLVAASAVALPAFAQDPGASAKMPPNVLLIVDTSGSMEYEAGLDTYPTCSPGGVGSERSRWIDLVEVLTGTVNNYSCESIDRASSKFTSLYRLPASPGGPASLNPPDYDYRNPYHRPLSGSCAPTPNVSALSALANAFDWAAPSFSVWNNSASPCTFSQSPDGLIDSFSSNIRFGLMTFDTLPDDSKGYSGTSPLYADGIEGAWSYFGSTAASGRPIGCIDPRDPMEVGARNGAAPAWEGKFIHFGNPDASSTANETRHTRIEQVLLSTRPYGATPIAGALTDAQTFLTLDEQTDPTSLGDPLHSTYYGPARDPYVQNGCRDQVVILLSDGEPYLDLRPYCEGATDPNEECPYHRPEDIASELNSLTTIEPIKTFVVGFADTNGHDPDSTDCTAMVADDWAPGGKCDAPATEQLRVCCTLHQIAYEGGTGKAYFGNEKAAVRSALSSVFNAILAGGGSATQPVRSPGIGDADSTGARAYRILTSYEAGTTGVWRGTVERLRWICNEDNVPEEADKDAGVGDDFSFNINSHPTARTFITYVPTTVSGTIHSDRSIRPNVASTDANVDSIGSNAGALVRGTPSAFVTGVDDAALQPDLGSGPCAGLTTSECKTLLLTWFVGGNNGTDYHRCASPASDPLDANCSVIGDVMHSTPVIVDHPSAEIEDETYVAYRTAHAGRPMMVYTSSNDGVLHGFKLSPNRSDDAQVNNSNSNEVFAFVPPAVLPQVDAQYPKSRQKLLDGVPIVQEVVATSNASNAYYPFKLERSQGNAATATDLTYRTILVQSFGGSQSGYFAVDITSPQATDAQGPRLLWQLTTDSAGNPLFGERTGTPLITTLMIGNAETAVAVLPGGHGSSLSSHCGRAVTAHPQIETGYEPRWNVRCYQYDQNNNGVQDAGDNVTYIGARSLTIVRLDTGEVVMRFRRNATDELPALPAAKVKAASLDSPLTGTPAAYPFGPGAVSDRIFVGDQDGTLWRIDTSSNAPSEWTMGLFFDTFSKHPGVGTPEEAGTAGRPIVVAPTLSINDYGQITVATATGDQDLSGGEGEEHFVWSLRETFNSSLTTARYETAVNWYQPLTDGEHVLGPLQLNEGILYYSTFKPETDNPCSAGESTIFAVDYLVPADANDRSAGGLGRLSLFDPTVETASNDRATAAELGLPVGTVIFGLNLEYSPSCHSTDTPSSTFLGGTHTSVTSASSSTLQLTFQTGSTNTSKKDLGFKTGFEAIGLNRPASGATIESWAAILE